MEDTEIVGLFFKRDEQAIGEAQRKYGRRCLSLARDLLGSREDAEECVSDALQRAWDSIPPQRPERLGAWLERVTRNVAVSRWRRDHAQKRGMGALVEELTDCVPDRRTPDEAVENARLGEAISRWLWTLPKDDRALFLRRYFDGQQVKTLAKDRGIPENRAAKRLFNLRLSLRAALEKEDFTI